MQSQSAAGHTVYIYRAPRKESCPPLTPYYKSPPADKERFRKPHFRPGSNSTFFTSGAGQQRCLRLPQVNNLLFSLWKVQGLFCAGVTLHFTCIHYLVFLSDNLCTLLYIYWNNFVKWSLAFSFFLFVLCFLFSGHEPTFFMYFLTLMASSRIFPFVYIWNSLGNSKICRQMSDYEDIWEKTPDRQVYYRKYPLEYYKFYF